MLLNQHNPHGGDVYQHDVTLDFSSNSNPYGTPQAVRDAVIRSADRCDVYPDPCCRELRRGIADYERVPREHILCGNGAAELIYAYAYALDDSRPALIVSPAFCEYQTALAAAGRSAEHYLLRKENGFTLTGDILSADLTRYSAVFLCTPNNPTGVTVEPDILYQIAAAGVKVFADMCFLDLTGAPDRYDIPDLVEKHPNIAVLRAFTKSHAMAGIRLGYLLCADGDLLNSLSRTTQCWNVSSIAQQAGIAALSCGEYLRDSVRLIGRERERMMQALRSCGVTVCQSEANYLLLYSDTDLYEKLLSRRILVRDCSDYVGLSKGYYRIAVRTPQENDQLLSAIKEVIS